MGKSWALEKKKKPEEAWPNLSEKKPQGAQKETGPRYRGAARTGEGIFGSAKNNQLGVGQLREACL